MGRVVRRLTAMRVAKASKPGLLHDGGGLYLQVTASKARRIAKSLKEKRAAKSWLFRYKGPNGSRCAH
jgi:hypothetical protein